MERGIDDLNLHYIEFIPDLIVHKKEFGESLMKVIDEQDVTYCNFINSLDSEYTKKYYKFCLVCDHVEKHKKEQSKGSEK